MSMEASRRSLPAVPHAISRMRGRGWIWLACWLSKKDWTNTAPIRPRRRGAGNRTCFAGEGGEDRSGWTLGSNRFQAKSELAKALPPHCQFDFLRRLHGWGHHPVLMLRCPLARQFKVLGESHTG